jgi:hypothetical protein
MINPGLLYGRVGLKYRPQMLIVPPEQRPPHPTAGQVTFEIEVVTDSNLFLVSRKGGAQGLYAALSHSACKMIAKGRWSYRVCMPHPSRVGSWRTARGGSVAASGRGEAWGPKRRGASDTEGVHGPSPGRRTLPLGRWRRIRSGRWRGRTRAWTWSRST